MNKIFFCSFLLYNIHKYLNVHYVLLYAFTYLKDKHLSSYKETFKIMKKKIFILWFYFSTKTYCYWFKKNIQRILLNFAKLIGCRFYITQSWWRAIQRFGLIKYYKTRIKIYDWLIICFGLVFLGFDERKPENLKLTRFTDYNIY